MIALFQARSRQKGDAARDKRRWPEATKYYRQHLRQHPNDFDIWVQCGHAEKERGRFEEAEKCYIAAAAIRPNDADLYLQRGHLAKLHGLTSDAAGLYMTALELDPRLEDARRELERLGPVAPLPAVVAPTLPEPEADAPPTLVLGDLASHASLAQAAIRLQEEGRLLEAAQVLRLVVRAKPEQREAWLALAEALLCAGDPEQASRCRTVAAAL